MNNEIVTKKIKQLRDFIHYKKTMAAIIEGNCSLIEDYQKEGKISSVLSSFDSIDRTQASLIQSMKLMMSAINDKGNLLLEDLLSEISGSFSDKRITLQHNFGPKHILCGSYIDLFRAFHHIIQNGIDALNKNPKGNVIITIIAKDPKIIINIYNSGPHIPTKDKSFKYLFEDGYSTKKGSKGLGLGIVQKIMKDHGATMGVKNVGVGGVAFFFEFNNTTKSALTVEEIKESCKNNK